MLKELKISDFAIIEDLTVTFESGLNVLTGETGAGKSIIIDALNLVLGGRADLENIRTGKTSSSVEALFYIDDPKILGSVSELGIEIEDGELILKRTLSSQEKNRTHLNGNNITVGNLSKIGDQLIDIHGQHDHQTLLHAENHPDVLDAYGQLLESKNLFGKLFRRYRQNQEQRDRLLSNERERLQREDLLTFQIGEIDQAGLNEKEEETLKTEKTKLASAEKIFESLQESLGVLSNDEGSVVERLRRVQQTLDRFVELDPELEKNAEQVQNLYYEAEDLVAGLQDYARSCQFHPGRLEEIEDRLAEINNLKRKYGSSIAAVLDYRETIAGELETLSDNQELVEQLQTEIATQEKELSRQAVALAEKREKAAAEFKKKVERELQDLNLKQARIDVRFHYEPKGFVPFRGDWVQLNANGIGTMEFLFSPNPGENPRPLAKIASGGEISRVMLALKTILNKQDQIPIMIFDEVDTGVGGSVAEKIGLKLKKIAANKQVFCITHLPQIAGMARTHYVIRKEVSRNRTRTLIRRLETDERIEEIARMSGGEKITEATRKHAREMIQAG